MLKFFTSALVALFVPAAALAQNAAPTPPSTLETLFPFLLIGAFFWLVILRPQMKKTKQHREMLKNLKRGDKVVTAGGILGKIDRIADDKDEVDLEIAPSVVVKILRGTISDVQAKPEPQMGVEKKDSLKAKK